MDRGNLEMLLEGTRQEIHKMEKDIEASAQQQALMSCKLELLNVQEVYISKTIQRMLNPVRTAPQR